MEESPPAPRETVVHHRSGQVWVTGRWVRDNGEWRWRSGYWVRERPDRVYVQGYWDFNGGRYAYRDGYWVARRPGQQWVEGRWVTGVNGRVAWRSGYWAPPPARAEFRVRARAESRAPVPSAPVAVPSDEEWRRRQDVREREFDRTQLLLERDFEYKLKHDNLTASERREARERFERQQKRREGQFATEQNRREKSHGVQKRRENQRAMRD